MRVEADTQAIATHSVLDVRPPAQAFSSKQLVWEKKDIDPVVNPTISFLGASPNQIIFYLEKIALQHPGDEMLRDTLKEMKRDFPDARKITERQKSFVQP